MRISLLGTSHWHAAMHLDAARHEGAEVIGTWDQDAAAAGRFAQAEGLKACSTLQDVLDSRPDLIVLMGDPRTVPTVAQEVIRAKIPMILEKPAAPRTSDIAPLVETAAESGAFVAVPLPNRFGPIFRAMTGLDGTGRLGTVAHGHFRIVNGPPQRYRDDGVGWLLDPLVGGGGALRNLGIHGIDAALSLARGPLRIVASSVGNRIHREPVEDHAVVTLMDEAGALFTVEAGYTYASMAPGGDFEWRVATANAYLIDHGESARCTTLDDGQSYSLLPEHPSTRYRLFMADTLDRIRRGVRPSVGIGDYYAAMRLIDQAYEKAKS
ncbi:Gfo/Idh/MocA family protein [Microvirga puerhi]|uniref:Gfo/Idh/MocA family oxidoreductase n=1 Tax=Microvirga puerhi TaxID=2876078 RepID=A0ABS7VMB8_9HYPH|nr:Gfo/Idh/MocA family oxidoreductase [Microvirga puerhi]MBZ6076683.1 Gfo/Idh/MocA family oxidoreductase [Microvirga puerhi]